jgi:tetratricopeptide (TPR) repeat protein
LKEPDIKPARLDLSNFRWEHAQARIAARRGNEREAESHVTAAKAILDKGTNAEQAQFLPYLQGYVAYYGGDYKTALDELLKANQSDPFIQCLIGQTYEKLGEKAKAIEFYRKGASASSHNPLAAYAVPFSKKRLAVLGTKERLPRCRHGQAPTTRSKFSTHCVSFRFADLPYFAPAYPEGLSRCDACVERVLYRFRCYRLRMRGTSLSFSAH